ncbi:DUF1643 domain-containing protein [Haliangium ochraceum]|uniref:DUF1643 domain-containing protein n=1 Tax=Haliangium ochraceum (strain DSM 14365 / JCM 11303 / SMP-2) TaxID=502025 RepID=D0LGB2_HALO1|nr:DUF1643 domain-containing protein [Haliangium ochraceum]ACY18137.1 protein of unknown function DUF1643 [Haliangium ochraceum DSM 14365]
MRRGATIDPSGRYRYRLWRTWDAAGTRVLFVMLNPSTADHRQDDPTIRRCIGFARAWGHGRLAVVNLFALRTPSVAELRRARAPVGPDNQRHLRASLRAADRVIAAWGVHGAARAGELLPALAEAARAPLECLGTTRDGHPRHPLYVRADVRPIRFVW